MSPTDRARCILGDTLAILPTLPAGSVDAIVTDPPYSSGGMYRGDRAKTTGEKYVHGTNGRQFYDFEGDTRDQWGWMHWTSLWLAECYRAAAPGALLAVFIDWRQLPVLTNAVQCGGWLYRGFIPWNKTEAVRPTKGWFRSQCEYVVLGSKGKPARMDETGQGDAPCLPGFFVCNVGEKHHQTGKPVDVCRWILSAARPGGLVLDPFMGAGSVGIASVQEGMRFLGIEMVPEYHQRSQERIAEALAQGRLDAIAGTVPAEPIDHPGQQHLFAAGPA